MDCVITIISANMSAKDRVVLRRVCKLSRNEFVHNEFTNASNYKLAYKVFHSLKYNASNLKRKKQNSWHRKLHTDDEVILLF